MSIIVDHNKCCECLACISACPFGAINYDGNKIEITDACVECKTCISTCPMGAISEEITDNITIKSNNKLSSYSGIMVLAQIENNNVLPVSLELLGKAKELANITEEKVYLLVLGHPDLCDNLASYNIDKIINYTNINYNKYNANEHISALYDAINTYKPSILLIGATNEGRQLAPQIASKFATGMTADCTNLLIKNNKLLQVRPAYGGKIMAEILTENSYPQIATVKNGMFEKIDKSDKKCPIEKIDFYEKDDIFNSIKLEEKPVLKSITSADILLCIGNGVKNKSDVELFSKVAEKLNATLCSSRALVEKGFMPPSTQIGLSGNSVSPKLLITFGVSGSIQFLAGIKNCKNVISVNTDNYASISKRANYFINADIYELASEILKK